MNSPAVNQQFQFAKTKQTTTITIIKQLWRIINSHLQQYYSGYQLCIYVYLYIAAVTHLLGKWERLTGWCCADVSSPTSMTNCGALLIVLALALVRMTINYLIWNWVVQYICVELPYYVNSTQRFAGLLRLPRRWCIWNSCSPTAHVPGVQEFPAGRQCNSSWTRGSQWWAQTADWKRTVWEGVWKGRRGPAAERIELGGRKWWVQQNIPLHQLLA